MTDELEFALQNIDNPDHIIRRRAFEVIERAGAAAMPGLIAILREVDLYRQEIAIGILWHLFREQRLTHPDLTAALISAIRANRNGNLLAARDGMYFLNDLKDPAAFDDLVEFLKEDEEDLREEAVEALGWLKDKRAIPYLAPLVNDEVELIRERALWAIGYIGHPDGISILAQNLDNPLTTYFGVSLAETAAWGLRAIGTPEALAAIEAWESEK